ARPGLAAVAGDVQPAVVAPRPDHALLLGARHDLEQSGEVLGGAGVDRQAAALRRLLPLRLVGGQVWADHRPGGAVVGGLVDVLAADVHRAGVERIDGEGGVPVEAELLETAARGRVRRLGVAELAGAQVPVVELAALRFGVAGHRVGGIGERLEAVAAAHRVPVIAADAAELPHRARAPPRAVVLQAAVDVVGRVHVHGHVVELAHRQGAHELPRLAAVAADAHAA